MWFKLYSKCGVKGLKFIQNVGGRGFKKENTTTPTPFNGTAPK